MSLLLSSLILIAIGVTHPAPPLFGNVISILKQVYTTVALFIAIVQHCKSIYCSSQDIVPARSYLQLLLSVSVLRSNPSRQQQLRCKGSDDHPADGSQPGHDGVSDEGLRMIKVRHAERIY